MGACGKAELHWPKRIAAGGGFGENRASDAHLEFCGMSILADLEVAQIGPGLAAAVCGRLFADVGARVTCIAPDPDWTPLARHLNHGKSVMSGDAAAARAAVASAALIVCEGRPRELRSREYSLDALRRIIRKKTNASSRFFHFGYASQWIFFNPPPFFICDSETAGRMFQFYPTLVSRLTNWKKKIRIIQSFFSKWSIYKTLT